MPSIGVYIKCKIDIFYLKETLYVLYNGMPDSCRLCILQWYA